MSSCLSQARDPNWNGDVTVVFAPDPSAPQRCGLIDPTKEIYMGWRQLWDQGANFPILGQPVFNPVMIYRYGPGGAPLFSGRSDSPR
jgi:hypothetical protein